MTPIRTQRLVLRNWQERDRDLFHRINTDAQVMAFFPIRRSRQESDALMDRLQARIASSGYGFAPIEIAETGQCAGFAGIADVDLAPVVPKGLVEIGWRLAPEHWGKGYATEAAKAWIDFGFNVLDLDEVVSFAVWNNHRSLEVMRRLGMRPDPTMDFDHPNIPANRPELKRHSFYRLRRADWRNAA